ncbi:MAG: hypothetical protein IPK16_27840 [Anaerolineales bacterium]|nr:hypothetical protein [Anaerolineales bacterium]
MQHRIDTLMRPDQPLDGVLYLAPPASPESGAVAAAATVTGALHLVQALLAHEGVRAPRLWFVTRGAQPVVDVDGVALAQAPLWGFARSVALERARLKCSIIDPRRKCRRGEVDFLCQELLGRWAREPGGVPCGAALGRPVGA